ncbi:MAG TPA: sulfur carrier protein ThiS [Candidatus Sumerlaeota bacterium]|nr:sulfur carrier protein ThiS [Candidatus Sumerlaeota bacterium]
MMRIRVNGESREVDQASSLLDLLRQIGLEVRNLAIEHNGEFVEEDRLGEVTLNEGDTLEIVRFVGGG